MSQSVTSSRMSAAWPQLHMQSNSWLYCAGTAPGSILRSLDRTPQLGTREQDAGGRLDRIESVKQKKEKGDKPDEMETPEGWNCSWRHE